jgi:hypothetical protein
MGLGAGALGGFFYWLGASERDCPELSCGEAFATGMIIGTLVGTAAGLALGIVIYLSSGNDSSVAVSTNGLSATFAGRF